ncbi:MAG: DegT/DnrJ/EryC1/StrS aminotransferase family protein [Leptospira sp.]|nr:DegT/DnrJ/EryC1/StrS aminotransferase family protein [Leptospira sp.]
MIFEMPKLQNYLEPILRSKKTLSPKRKHAFDQSKFEESLATWWGTPHVVSCANGTDALLLALLALDLPKGSLIAIPSFNYVSAGEVCCMLGFKPLWIDVNPDTYLSELTHLESVYTPACKAVVVPHLFGQGADMQGFMEFASTKGLWVIEDNAQSMGATFIKGKFMGRKVGTVGHIGTTSFFPTKPIACMGDGGAICTSDKSLARRIRMLASHGQSSKYHYEKIGLNSRLDALQAAILNVKLPYVQQNAQKREVLAKGYCKGMQHLKGIQLPLCDRYTTHVYHQFTIKVLNGSRDRIREKMQKQGVETMVYYPLPLHNQIAFSALGVSEHTHLTNAETLASQVLSLPIHPTLSSDMQEKVLSALKSAIEE